MSRLMEDDEEDNALAQRKPLQFSPVKAQNGLLARSELRPNMFFRGYAQKLGGIMTPPPPRAPTPTRLAITHIHNTCANSTHIVLVAFTYHVTHFFFAPHDALSPPPSFIPSSP